MITPPLLPSMARGDEAKHPHCQPRATFFTQPPPRFTDASLCKTHGRIWDWPSIHSCVDHSNVVQNQYVVKIKAALSPKIGADWLQHSLAISLIVMSSMILLHSLKRSLTRFQRVNWIGKRCWRISGVISRQRSTAPKI